jgi:hypothetical protein
MSERVKMGLEVVKATHTYYGSSLYSYSSLDIRKYILSCLGSLMKIPFLYQIKLNII